ncbi:MAG TPA: hypothetical protein DEF21_00340 [Thalassospira lucentensis]|uniref:Uncharacterized protein n=1 Tax=Thalassospira lucentensis TaxID=168935 RepID=A0A358HMC4_9PROT|nr:hypothetical protein [Thalassospira lucentensis]HCW69456.1 hypothetical protein [Thalassospira lucentensis]
MSCAACRTGLKDSNRYWRGAASVR